MVKVTRLAKRRLVLVNERGYPVGEDHHRAKRTDADIELVLALRDAGLGYGAIAAKFDDVPGGVSRSWVRDVCRGIIRAQHPCACKRVAVRISLGLTATVAQHEPPMDQPLPRPTARQRRRGTGMP